jgi:hypothetical protein
MWPIVISNQFSQELTFNLSPLEVKHRETFNGILSANLIEYGIETDIAFFREIPQNEVSYMIMKQPSQGSLTILGNKLFSIKPIDNVVPFTILVRGFYKEFVRDIEFTIKVIDTVPDLFLSLFVVLQNNYINENAPKGTLVGEFTTVVDINENATKTLVGYSFVSGEGSTDNNLFGIMNNKLYTNTVFNYNVKSKYQIRVKSTTSFGNVEQSFNVYVIIPYGLNPTFSALVNTPKRIDLTSIGSSISGQELIYTIIKQPSSGKLTQVSNGVYNLFVPDFDEFGNPFFPTLDNFVFKIREGTLSSLPIVAVIQVYTPQSLNFIPRVQGTLTFDKIQFNGDIWSFGTIQSDYFFNTLGDKNNLSYFGTLTLYTKDPINRLPLTSFRKIPVLE